MRSRGLIQAHREVMQCRQCLHGVLQAGVNSLDLLSELVDESQPWSESHEPASVQHSV